MSVTEVEKQKDKRGHVLGRGKSMVLEKSDNLSLFLG